ncbi:hypothetical protein Gasu2_23100 [Galdieria sulphuraria]|uniref:Uncharacterized protein n=1 Tax=Galdieria sulphuraria TaxID=130081 RepID=M2X058_GALSU|nr:uncharacterized protein Gasu_29360 [Galdieria sulphuraria]EME29715.1 hypothetical protein Gasu_29360 [Galdieria sulphuraria]GJD07993.1 hypothetical protein Gasu2_23100 [Galdieria sulphuraria]|eukprot:XP_005706235.1 hypothetical protein Gasu_29360 [Galdieria sulphuraria]
MLPITLWKLSSSLLRLQVPCKITSSIPSTANFSRGTSFMRYFNTSQLLKSSEEKETFHFMPLSYNEDVRAVSGLTAPDEPPHAPLPKDHELNGDCDFSRQLDMHEDVSDREAAIGTALLVLIFGGGYYLAEYVFPKEYKVTRTELPYLEQDLGGYLKLDETGTQLIPQFDFVTYAAPDTPQCGYLSTIKKIDKSPSSPTTFKENNNNYSENFKDNVQSNGKSSMNNNHVEASDEPDYDKYIQGSS